MNNTGRKKRFFGIREIIFALLTSAIITIGRCIYNLNSLSWLIISFTEYLAIFAILFLPFLLLYAFIGRIVSKGLNLQISNNPGNEIDVETEEGPKAEKKLPVIYRILPFVTFVLVLASCVTALLAYFPGILAYDSEWQTLQATGLLPLSNHHPVLHTLIWNAFLLLETAGVPHPYSLVAYCIFQMLIVSAACACVVKAEVSEGCKWYYELLTVLFYVLYPAFNIFSIEMTKDVLFSCAVVLLVLNILKAGRGEKVNVIFFFVTVTLACLLRNNFLPAAFIMLAVLLIIGKKEKMIKYFVTALLAVIISCTIMFAVYPLCGVKKGESREALSVPINQIAAVCVYRPAEITVAEEFIIDKYMSTGLYNPRLADAVKFSFDSDLYDSDRSAFWDLYFFLFAKHPDVYIDSFLTQNVSLWYPCAEITDRYAKRDYIETENVNIVSYAVTGTPIIPELYYLYQNMITEIENAGLIERFGFSLSIPFFVLLIGFYIAGVIRRPSYTAALLTIFALWGTYLLGPVSAFRYMYTFFLLIPVILSPVFGGRISAARKKESDKQIS